MQSPPLSSLWLANWYFAHDSSSFLLASAASPLHSERPGMEGRRAEKFTRFSCPNDKAVRSVRVNSAKPKTGSEARGPVTQHFPRHHLRK